MPARKVCSNWPDAVKKMTAEPARRLGITDRGTVAVGAVADLVIFDPDTVIDNSEFGQEAGPPAGIDVVIVGGSVVLDHGTIGDARPGRVLRKTPTPVAS